MKVRNIFKKFVNPLYLLRKSELGGRISSYIYMLCVMLGRQCKLKLDCKKRTEKNKHTEDRIKLTNNQIIII